MQKGAVYCNKVFVGDIEKRSPVEYVFRYDDVYYADPDTSDVSLTMPKTQQVYTSDQLFPFFAGLLTEGINKEIQCRLLKIDEQDDFTRLIKTAGEDTIGAITVKEI